MARKPTQAAQADYPKGFPELPFIMVDSTSMVGFKPLIVARSALAWVGLRVPPATYVFVGDYIIHDHECALKPTRGKRYHVWHVDSPEHRAQFGNSGYETHMKNLRSLALLHGATPEAIRLLGEIQPFTKKEVEDMANKLGKKAAPAKPAKAEGAAKPAKGKSGGKGNAEALKKARAARAEAGPDVRKITVVKKDNPYREGSGRAASFNALKGAATVEDYKKAGGKVKYIARWAAEGIIKVV